MENQERTNRQANRTLEVNTADGLNVSVNHNGAVKRIIEGKNNKPLFILISGTSESGKSHFGKKFVDDVTGSRVKFYRSLSFCREFKNRSNQQIKLFDFATTLDSDIRIQNNVIDTAIKEYTKYYRQTNCPIFVVETIKHQWIVDAFKRRPDVECLSLYIDASFKQRVQRESNKTGISIAQLEQLTKDKDRDKITYGAGKVARHADITISNNGLLTSYNRWIENFAQILKVVKQNKGGWKPIDFSNA